MGPAGGHDENGNEGSCYPVGVPVSSDIIAAVATAPGPGAIAVVRVSGPGSHALALRLCRDLSVPPPDRRLQRTWIVHPASSQPLDQALVVFFPPGSSYTGEEVVEIQCHGGLVTPQRILEACLAAGARSARPGEFTRRALASGRLDLLQAEAIALLVEAQTEEAANLALRAIAGEPSHQVAALREDLLDALADCEAALDFAEEDGVDVEIGGVMRIIENAVFRMEDWLARSRAARACVEGVRIALIGPPNAGKSSLFNALVGRDRAIVHEEPGTTRDLVTERTSIAGVPCSLTDTAGLHQTQIPVEAEGVRRAIRAAQEADIVILVLDGSLRARPGAFPRCDLCVASKMDLWPGQGPAFVPPPGVNLCATSVVTGAGLEDLRDRLATLVRQHYENGRAACAVLVGERQVSGVAAARDETAAALQSLRLGDPLEVVASHLRLAIEHLGELTGSRVTDEVLDRVFRRFCVGK